MIVKKPILYISYKVKGSFERRRRNALAFIRLFLIIISHLSFEDSKGTKKIKFGDILELIGRQSQFTLITLAVFPLALPIPYPPGLPSILSIPVFIFIINGLVGDKFIKIPDKVLNYSMELDTFKKMITHSRFIIVILARISRGGRMAFLAEDQMQKIHLSFMILMALAILIPFPGTNYLPALSIFVISIGCVLTDGIIVTLGYIMGIIGIFLVTLFVIFGKKIVLTFIESVKYFIY